MEHTTHLTILPIHLKLLVSVDARSAVVKTGLMWPCDSEKNFKAFYGMDNNGTGEGSNGGAETHVTILDRAFSNSIGALSLKDNHPRDLTIRLG